jgi:hypothetical protein
MKVKFSFYDKYDEPILSDVVGHQHIPPINSQVDFSFGKLEISGVVQSYQYLLLEDEVVVNCWVDSVDDYLLEQIKWYEEIRSKNRD